MDYLVRVRGSNLQVVGELEQADAIYDAPAGLGVMDYLPAGCPFRRPAKTGGGAYRPDLNKWVPVAGIPEVSPAPPAPVVGLGIDSLR